MQIVHKPDCELVRHRQQFSKCIDLKLSKLTGGEPQDQGYASERSPEDEHPPSLPGQPFPNITPGELHFPFMYIQSSHVCDRVDRLDLTIDIDID